MLTLPGENYIIKEKRVDQMSKKRQLKQLLEVQREYAELLLTMDPGAASAMLKAEAGPDPDWMLARAKNLLLKLRIARASMLALLERGDLLKAEYIAEYGEDRTITIQDQAILEPIRSRISELDGSIADWTTLRNALRAAKEQQEQVDLAALLAGIR